MKIIKYIFLIIWTLWSLFGIIRNCSHYKFTDWILIISFVAMPYLILWYLAHRKAKEKSDSTMGDASPTVNATVNISQGALLQPIEHSHSTALPVPEPGNAKNESAINKLEVAQNMLDESLKQLNEAVSSGNIFKVTVQQSNISSAEIGRAHV